MSDSTPAHATLHPAITGLLASLRMGELQVGDQVEVIRVAA